MGLNSGGGNVVVVCFAWKSHFWGICWKESLGSASAYAALVQSFRNVFFSFLLTEISHVFSAQRFAVCSSVFLCLYVAVELFVCLFLPLCVISVDFPFPCKVPQKPSSRYTDAYPALC